MGTGAPPLEFHLGVWMESLRWYECGQREFQVHICLSRCVVLRDTGKSGLETRRGQFFSLASNAPFRPRSISEQESDSEFDRGLELRPRDAPSPPLASSVGKHSSRLASSRSGRSTAYPWWAAGSQVPGSRTLCTALLRRTLSW